MASGGNEILPARTGDASNMASKKIVKTRYTECSMQMLFALLGISILIIEACPGRATPQARSDCEFVKEASRSIVQSRRPGPSGLRMTLSRSRVRVKTAGKERN